MAANNQQQQQQQQPSVASPAVTADAVQLQQLPTAVTADAVQLQQLPTAVTTGVESASTSQATRNNQAVNNAQLHQAAAALAAQRSVEATAAAAYGGMIMPLPLMLPRLRYQHPNLRHFLSLNAANFSYSAGDTPISMAALQQSAGANLVTPSTILTSSQQETVQQNPGSPVQGQLLPGRAQIISMENEDVQRKDRIMPSGQILQQSSSMVTAASNQAQNETPMSTDSGGAPISLDALQQNTGANFVNPVTILTSTQPQTMQQTPGSPVQGQLLPEGAQIISTEGEDVPRKDRIMPSGQILQQSSSMVTAASNQAQNETPMSTDSGGAPISLDALQQNTGANFVNPVTILTSTQPQTMQQTPGSPVQGQLLPEGAQIISTEGEDVPRKYRIMPSGQILQQSSSKVTAASNQTQNETPMSTDSGGSPISLAALQQYTGANFVNPATILTSTQPQTMQQTPGSPVQGQLLPEGAQIISTEGEDVPRKDRIMPSGQILQQSSSMVTAASNQAQNETPMSTDFGGAPISLDALQQNTGANLVNPATILTSTQPQTMQQTPGSPVQGQLLSEGAQITSTEGADVPRKDRIMPSGQILQQSSSMVTAASNQAQNETPMSTDFGGAPISLDALQQNTGANLVNPATILTSTQPQTMQQTPGSPVQGQLLSEGAQITSTEGEDVPRKYRIMPSGQILQHSSSMVTTASNQAQNETPMSTDFGGAPISLDALQQNTGANLVNPATILTSTQPQTMQQTPGSPVQGQLLSEGAQITSTEGEDVPRKDRIMPSGQILQQSSSMVTAASNQAQNETPMSTDFGGAPISLDALQQNTGANLVNPVTILTSTQPQTMQQTPGSPVQGQLLPESAQIISTEGEDVPRKDRIMPSGQILQQSSSMVTAASNQAQNETPMSTDSGGAPISLDALQQNTGANLVNPVTILTSTQPQTMQQTPGSPVLGWLLPGGAELIRMKGEDVPRKYRIMPLGQILQQSTSMVTAASNQAQNETPMSTDSGGAPISLDALQQNTGANLVNPATILTSTQPQTMQQTPGSPVQGQLLPEGAQIISTEGEDVPRKDRIMPSGQILQQSSSMVTAASNQTQNETPMSTDSGGAPISLAALQQNTGANFVNPVTILTSTQPQTMQQTSGSPGQGWLLPGGAQLIRIEGEDVPRKYIILPSGQILQQPSLMVTAASNQTQNETIISTDTAMIDGETTSAIPKMKKLKIVERVSCECPYCRIGGVFFPVGSRKRIHICPLIDCNRTFPSTTYLLSHLSTHTGVKLFECPWTICARKFSTLGNLKQHILKTPHRGERKYHCSDCDKYFITSAHLSNHKDT